MDNDIASVCKSVALVAGIGIFLSAIYWINDRDDLWRERAAQAIVEMVKAGASPAAAQCAVFNNIGEHCVIRAEPAP